ncbi:MAG TPA: nuclear transport factor 2 family protein [Hyphomicrobiaceae bacterium]|nr:nuclear transport factor 2 family protein [Hyphomicrobiaceae bacterium]
MDSKSVVASFLKYWSVQDLEMALEHLHPKIVYTLHNGPDARPFSGSYHGIDACRDLGYTVLAEFDYLRYEPTILSAAGSTVQVHVVSRIRHRATAHVIEGSQRSVFQVHNGLITCIDIFEDARRIEAFMRLTTQRMANDMSPAVPALMRREKHGSGR